MPKKIIWHTLSSRGVNHPTVLLEQITKSYSRGYFGPAHKTKFSVQTYRQCEGTRGFSESDVAQFKKILKKYLDAKPELLVQMANEFMRRCTLAKRIINSIAKHDFQSATNKQLFDYYKKYFDAESYRWTYAYTYMVLNEIASEYLDRLAKKYASQKYAYTDLIQYFTRPVKETDSMKFLKDLARANTLRRGRDQFLNKLAQKYAHLGFYGWRGQPLTIKKISEMNPKTEKPKKFPNLGLAKRKKAIIDACRWWIYASTQADILYAYTRWRLEPLWEQIGKKLKLNIWEVGNLTYEEAEKYVTLGSMPQNTRLEIKKRGQNSVYIYVKGETTIYTGKKMARYIKAEKKDTEAGKNIRELKGQVGCKGFAKGPAQIISRPDDAHKMKRGGVLIAVMTSPAYVPVMNKAAAIVTDEGGMLSHAAVVSREMNVPCVIGTKIATRILKDGDMVEVDANRGIVKF